MQYYRDFDRDRWCCNFEHLWDFSLRGSYEFNQG